MVRLVWFGFMVLGLIKLDLSCTALLVSPCLQDLLAIRVGTGPKFSSLRPVLVIGQTL